MKWILMALCSAPMACGAAPTRGTTEAWYVAAPNASLARYRTFAFGLSDQPKPGFLVTPRSLEVQRRLRPAVEKALQDRGYVENEDKADLIVKLATGTGSLPSERADVEGATPTGFTPAFIGVSVYDNMTGSQIWQGSAYAEIKPDKIDDSLLEAGVSNMLASFPARQTASVASAP